MKDHTMNTKFATSLALVDLVTAGALYGTAFAAGPDQEATALQSAKISLSQAVASAEQQTGGRAYDAGVAVKGGQTRIVVETNGPKGVQTVAIDAQSGQVVDSHSGGETD